MTKTNSFPKSEHLCGEKRIAELYTKGEAFIAYPIRVVFKIAPKEDEIAARAMMSVPKKRFKRAVKRNRLKRSLREAYRLNKQELITLLEKSELKIDIAFNYVSDEEMDYIAIEKKMKLALSKLTEKIKLVSNKNSIPPNLPEKDIAN